MTLTGELDNTKLLKLSMGSFKFACTLSGVKCGNHDTEVMPQLLIMMWVTLIKFEKMVEMTVISAVFRAFRVLTLCQDRSVFQTSYYSYRSRYRDIEERPFMSE